MGLTENMVSARPPAPQTPPPVPPLPPRCLRAAPPARSQQWTATPACATPTASTSAAPSTCTVSSGPAAGQSCVFPFTYGGTTFSGCAEWVYGGERQGKLWCSTKVDSTGTHVNGEGNYGFCSSTCTAVSLFDLIGNLLGDGSTSTAQRRGSGSVVFGSSSSTSSRVRAILEDAK